LTVVFFLLKGWSFFFCVKGKGVIADKKKITIPSDLRGYSKISSAWKSEHFLIIDRQSSGEKETIL
jgi:hypothetical protein